MRASLSMSTDAMSLPSGVAARRALAVLLAAACGGFGQRSPALPHQPACGPLGTHRTEQAGHHHRKANADEHRDRRIEEGLDVGAVGVLQAQQRGQVHRQRQCEQRALRVMQHQPQWQEHRRQHQRDLLRPQGGVRLQRQRAQPGPQQPRRQGAAKHACRGFAHDARPDCVPAFSCQP
ncbi:hypothetical protein G6F32_014678 [Rhizopus arrhizus]|nr:hypothetical protein G6F32_014678 [Rhizopus arrhizus]